MLYMACRQAGVIRWEHDEGMARVLKFCTLGMSLAGTWSTGRWPIGSGNVTVGWTRSRWSWSSAGIEYESVRTASTPVSPCLKMEKSALKSSLALLTGSSTDNQSPEGEIVSAVIPLSFNQALTALMLS